MGDHMSLLRVRLARFKNRKPPVVKYGRIINKRRLQVDIKQKKLKIVPLELRELNELVAKYHRHHKKVQGHMLSIGASVDGQIVGGASIGRPVARSTCRKTIVEVTRLV
jgi:hypothetical protein